MLHTFFNRLAARFGYRLAPLVDPPPPDLASDALFLSIYQKVRPYTMTSMERLYALHQAVRYVVEKKIPGDFVECGVWRGGSCMMMALTLESIGAVGRKIHLYDTFEGMSEPTAADRQHSGESAENLLQKEDKSDPHSIWCASAIDDVRANVGSTGLPADTFIFHKGKVEDTIPAEIPEAICLLRLDTDWYASTRHELQHLYPLLGAGGSSS